MGAFIRPVARVDSDRERWKHLKFRPGREEHEEQVNMMRLLLRGGTTVIRPRWQDPSPRPGLGGLLLLPGTTAHYSDFYFISPLNFSRLGWKAKGIVRAYSCSVTWLQASEQPPIPVFPDPTNHFNLGSIASTLQLCYRH